MLETLAGLALRRRRAVVVVALLLAVLGGAAGSTLFTKLTAGGFDDPRAESGRAASALTADFGHAQSNLTLLVTAPGGVDEPAASAAGASLGAELADEPQVADVISYWGGDRAPQLRGAGGDKALILATITGDETEVEARVKELLPRYQGTHDGLEVKVGGYAPLQHEIIDQGQKDATKGEMIAFPVTLVLLVFVFGSLVAAALPLVVALVTVLLCMGFMWILASLTSLSSLSVSVITLLGLGLAIDYSLLIVNRYREQLRAGHDEGEAVRGTLRSAGRTVVFSAVTVAVALAGLAWFPLPAVRSMAYAGVATALLAALASVTLLPALLVALGPRIEKGRVFRRRERPVTVELENGFWHRLATVVMRRPLPIATLVTAFLLLLGAPFLGINLGMPDERTLPESSMARQVVTEIRAEFDTSEQSALQVVVPGARGNGEVDSYATELSRMPDVARVDTATGSYADGARASSASEAHQRFRGDGSVFLSVTPASADADLTAGLVREIRGAPAPSGTLVGGTAAVNEDATSSMIHWLPYALVSVVLAMLVLLFLVTGSVLVPFIAVLLSALSLTATFGALVWIFQDGHLAGLLGGFTVTGDIAATVPVMLFALSFGLAMDYQIFLLARIREEYEITGDGSAAVARGLERIGRIVTAAAVLISVVFLAFAVSDITLSKAYGIGLPLAVLMDATLIRGLLLPALMRLGGRATWWAPAPLRRVHARFGLKEYDGAPDAEHPVPVTAARAGVSAPDRM
ncbi:MMPL family transporter [Streptomyces sp. NBC_01725]|uniref:MMPL family transporter n=1 Tax=Streptomyces sp. NBC_01725 TaxID=2975923 RepID=UPI002E2D0584|nr:MMPL family transporter [Streptomyces sp. NBC_01725]